jgi:hypothetical protein
LKILRMRASQRIRDTVNSSAKPLPPWTCTALPYVPVAAGGNIPRWTTKDSCASKQIGRSLLTKGASAERPMPSKPMPRCADITYEYSTLSSV